MVRRSICIWMLLLVSCIFLFGVVGVVAASPDALFLTPGLPILFGFPAVKSIGDIAKKWGRVAPTRTEDYDLGVRNPKKDWAGSTIAAEGSYKEAVVKAAGEGRFGKGVSAAGTKKWQTKAIEKGTQRWGPGVQIAMPDYEQGFAKFRDVIEKTTLPPRYPKGDPRNIQRVSVMAAALAAARKIS